MTVEYEWDVEECVATDCDNYEVGEVLEHWHQSSYADAYAFSRREPPAGMRYELVLVRDDGNGRSWAYCDESGRLPAAFEDAYQREVARVPKRFIDEVARILAPMAA